MSSSSVFALSNRSEEFRRVDYLLKLSLRTSAIHDVAVWHFHNPHLVARFEDRTSNIEVLHAWVKAEEVEVSLDTLASRGFIFGANGQKFITGTLDFDDEDQQAVQKFILCQIGVGRSYVQDDASQVDFPSPDKPLPDGFDSIFVARPEEATSENVYRHEYILFDPSQALPMYLVQFIPGSDKSKRLLEWPGSGLKNQMASNVDSLYDRYDFFDPVYYVPVSVRDKMVGSHSFGEAALHKLIGIGDAYDAAISESLKSDPLLAQRQAEIKTQLRAVDAKLRDVNRNSAEVEERIYKALQDALFQLQEETQKKLNALLAEEVELRRQLKHIDWIETFLDKQRDEAEQVDFLNAWKCHVQLRGDVCRHSLRTSDILSTIQADLEFEGEVRVVSRGSMQKYFKAPSLNSKRKQKNATIEGMPLTPSGRKGSGTMTISGTPSPIQNEDQPYIDQGKLPPIKGPTSSSSFMAQQQSTNPSNSAIPLDPSAFAPDLEVTRAFIEALKREKEASRVTIDEFSLKQSNRIEQVPPTPPSIKPSNLKHFQGFTNEDYLHYSLFGEAARRKRNLPDPQLCFFGSRIISSEVRNIGEDQLESSTAMSPAQALFLVLPFQARRTQLLYTTIGKEAPKVEDLLDSIPVQNLSYSDEQGVHTYIQPENIPTILLIKANDRVFGGFANEPWMKFGENFGSSKCFLFSIDEDLKIPFIGRDSLKPGPKWSEILNHQGLHPPRFASLYADPNTIKFGTSDLVLSNGFKEGSSELEHCYGIGLPMGSNESQTLLAGASRFVCDAVELWGIEQ